MGNLLKMKAALAALACFAPVFPGALAQGPEALAQGTANAQLIAPPTLMAKTSASDVGALLKPLGITLAPFDDGDDSVYTVTATTDGGAQFLITLFSCADPLTGAGCEGLTSYVGFSNAGLSYEDLNRFNADATVSKAVNVAEQNAVIFGVQQYLIGGVSADNMQYVMILFLNDVDNFQTGASSDATSVAYEQGRKTDASKTGNLLSAGEGAASDKLGPYSMRAAIASAINNTGRVTFDVKSPR